MAGTFISMKDKLTNVIWIRTPLPPAYVQHIMNYDEFYELVHEYAHFFSKKAGWNEVIWDYGMTEAILPVISSICS